MKNLFISLVIILAGVQYANGAFPTTGASSDSYCFVPPYMTENVKPNIDIVIDASESMQQPAYMQCSRSDASIYAAGCQTRTLTGTDLYNKDTDYYGYFDNTKYYKYTTASNYFEVNSTCSVDPLRRGNTNIGSSSTGGAACLSGNLLNWIIMTRVDTVRKIMTGGRVKSGSTTATTKVLESDGATYASSGYYTDTNLQCNFYITATNTASATTKSTYTITRKIQIANQGSNTCALGTLPASYTNVLTPIEDVSGLVQGMANQAVLEVEYFSDSQANFKVGKNNTVDNYVNAINSEAACGNTPSGTALIQAKAFFNQTDPQSSSLLTSANQTLVYGRGNYLKDPYYDSDGGTTPSSLPVPCRKSFVLLLSDGRWPDQGTYSENMSLPENSMDPVQYANAMRTTDQRTGTGFDTAPLAKQTVATYVVYAFGDGDGTDYGRNSLIATAIFGGFTDKYGSTGPTSSPDTLPYPFTALPKDSRSTRTTVNYTTYAINQCNPSSSPYHIECSEWDPNKKGLPYNYFEGNDGAALKTALDQAVQDMLTRASSGTAASMLGNSDSSGAVMLQAVFYPEREFDASTKAQWLGELQAFWYYIDPSLSSSKVTLREDTINDWKLKITEDNIAKFVFNDTNTMVDLYTTGADGITPSSTFTEVSTDDVITLWRAGLTLWSRMPTGTGGRSVYTNDLNTTPAASKLMSFGTSTLSLLTPYLDVASNATDATNVINYTLGLDPPNNDLASTEKDSGLAGYRSRTVSIVTPGSPPTTVTHVWKLGDIINSTPKMISPNSLNTYNNPSPSGYNDSTYDKFISTTSYKTRGVAFVGANDGMLHAFNMGRNIPASSGYVSQIVTTDGSGNNVYSSGVGSPPTGLGKELWAYVPKNVLPYLKHRGNPNFVGNKHLYYLDSTPTIVDASLNPITGVCSNNSLKGCTSDSDCGGGSATCNAVTCTGSDCPKVDTSWRTVLIGSMGYGGATRDTLGLSKGVAITINAAKQFTRTSGDFTANGWAVGKIFTSSGFTNAGNNGTFTISAVTALAITVVTTTGLVAESASSASLVESAVKTPSSGSGYSSYFALDITDSSNPKLLWEFANPRLGYSTVGPAIVRIKDASETGATQKNGKYFVVLASGPTGPIDTDLQQLKGFSDQPLALFVLDMRTGTVERTFSNDTTALITGVNHTTVASMPNSSYGGSLSNSTIDTDKPFPTDSGSYSDDAIYLGYVRKDTTTGNSYSNKFTKGGVLRILTADNPDTANWSVSTVVDGTGPVSSSIGKLQDTTNRNLWLYFGTGRYFYKNGSNVDEDYTGQNEAIYGIKDPCYYKLSTDPKVNDLNPACTSSVTLGALQDQTTFATFVDTNPGWKINLGTAPTDFKAPRIYTNPTATIGGVVYFTSFKPSAAVCSYGGNTSLWAVKYNTGGSLSGSNLLGQALLQLSTGELRQVNLNTEFTNSGNRQSGDFTGPPSKDETQITSNANHFPSRKILHIQER
jgi:type IV pilus assembly protein PilY1